MSENQKLSKLEQQIEELKKKKKEIQRKEREKQKKEEEKELIQIGKFFKEALFITDLEDAKNVADFLSESADAIRKEMVREKQPDSEMNVSEIIFKHREQKKMG